MYTNDFISASLDFSDIVIENSNSETPGIDFTMFNGSLYRMDETDVTVRKLISLPNNWQTVYVRGHDSNLVNSWGLNIIDAGGFLQIGAYMQEVNPYIGGYALYSQLFRSTDGTGFSEVAYQESPIFWRQAKYNGQVYVLGNTCAKCDTGDDVAKIYPAGGGS